MVLRNIKIDNTFSHKIAMGWSAANKELEEPYKNRILQEIQ
jgi:hypothetical protein